MRADPHCHTTASDGMVSPAELVAAAIKAQVDLIAVTDHDTMASVKAAQSRGNAAGLTVVAGQEVTTAWPAQTHIVGWFLETPIKRGMSLEDTVAAIHAQGALVMVPHPFMPVYFGSIQPGMLRRLIEKQSVDAIEILSTVPIGTRRRKLLHEFYEANRDRLGAPIGASDCHFGAADMARAMTEYEGDFRTAVMERTTKPLAGVRHPVPKGIALRQQWRALIELPIERIRRG
ncbi:MAG TPA: PHP domain-containing protein [Candidatus Acidoferrum sp.]|nr:PHP domain-containing protein [Candidatus Acidoferrum sp.]